MHVAILYDGHAITEWQRRALELITPAHRLSFLVHEASGMPSPRKARHGFYYGLNLLAIRNRLTRSVRLVPPSGAEVKRFSPGREGAWSTLSADALAWLRDNRVDAVLKFGLGLLKIPDDAPPILSYHHGDPRAFRGRPAGFYEMLKGEPFVGQIVQRLCNRVDAGSVLAFTQTRVHPHSYRKTLEEAFEASPLLLPRALAALEADETLPIEPTGPNYRLPGNFTVARLMARSGSSLARRLLYGAFVEKRWSVSSVTLSPDCSLSDLARKIEDHRTAWDTPPLLPGYTFYADGFFHSGPSDMLVEAMNARTGKGELVRISNGVQQRISVPEAGHISYPQTIEEDGARYVVPETASWSPPTAFSLDGDALQRVKRLDIDVDALIDPTFFRHEGKVYLFGNRAGNTTELHLWVADGLFGRFEVHPSSPICVGSRGSRMAGDILRHDGSLVRLGQDYRKGYGDGIICYRIDRLGPDGYRETKLSELSFKGVSGPHTLNRKGDQWLFDWYVERRSPLAGVRRLRNRFSS